MAVAFDAVQAIQYLNNASSGSANFTPVGTPTAAITNIHHGFNSTTVSTVTYGGTSETLVDTKTQGGANPQRATIFGLAGPASGTKSVAVTMSGNEFASFYARSVTGSDTSTLFTVGHKATGGAANTGPTCAPTSSTNELVLDCMTTAAGTVVVDASQTEDMHDAHFGVLGSYASHEAAGASSTTMSWSLGAGVDWAIVAVSLKEAAASSSVIKTFLGLANASTKTVNALANASVKTFDGVANT